MSEDFNSLLSMLRNSSGQSSAIPGQDQPGQAQYGAQQLAPPPSYSSSGIEADLRNQTRSVPPFGNLQEQQHQRPPMPPSHQSENFNPSSLLEFLRQTGESKGSAAKDSLISVHHIEPQERQASAPPHGQPSKPPQSRQLSAQDLVDQMLKRVPANQAPPKAEGPDPAHQQQPPAPAPAPLQQPPPQQEQNGQPTAPAPDPPKQSTPKPVNAEDLVMQLFGRTKPTQQPAPQQTPPPPPHSQGSPAPQSPVERPPASPPVPGIPSTAPLSSNDNAEWNKPAAERSESPSSSLLRMISGSPPPPPPIHQSFFPPAAPTPPSGTPAPSEPNSPAVSQSMFNHVNPFETLSATRPRKDGSRAAGKPSALRHQESAGQTPEPHSVPLPFSPPEGNSPSISEKTLERTRTLSPDEQLLRDQLASSVADAGSEREASVRGEDKPASVSDAHQPPVAEAAAQSPKPADAAEPPSQPPAEPARESAEPANALPAQEESAPVQETTSRTFVPAEAPPTPAPEPEEFDDDNLDFEDAILPIEGKTYTFPMKPFSSLTINPPLDDASRPLFPENRLSDIAKMPRSTNQLDRNLITGSDGYIAYAMSKNRGGIRIIRQDDGKDRLINKESSDRSFNLTIGRGERLLATTVSGAVIWADLAEGFESPDWAGNMFILPPHEDQQGPSNGVLKSRARKTLKHIDVFAVGRGKKINLVHVPTALAYCENKTVNSQKYFAEHSRVIDTGKASKDFCFSEDDTVILSVDKAGKLKLWDVEALVNYRADYTAATPQPPLVLSTPAITLNAVGPGESYRATSIMLLDKAKPFLKGQALRYAIVGMKQNYTLQLWDLSLGKPVQELNFPQLSENDGMCSINYHAPSGNIIIGNPARNSVFLIHFSAPRYNLANMTQAEFVRAIASKNEAKVPTPDATAILSVIREYSLDNRGSLISLDILDRPLPPSADEVTGDTEPVLEVFVAHTKGVTSINLYRSDVNLDSEFKSKHAINAVDIGICSIAALASPPSVSDLSNAEASEPSKSGRQSAARQASTPSISTKPTPSATPAIVDKPERAAGTVKHKKSQRMLSPTPAPAAASIADEVTSSAPAAPAAPPSTRKERRDKGKSKAANVSKDVNGAKAETNTVELKVLADKLTTTLEKTVIAALNTELDTLRKGLDEERSNVMKTSEKRHQEVLRVVSDTLTNNVEKSLASIVHNSIRDTVSPQLINVATTRIDEGIDRVITHRIREQLPGIVSGVVGSIIPGIVQKEVAESNRQWSEHVIAKVQKANVQMLDDFGKRIHGSFVENVRESFKKKDAEISRIMEQMHQQNAKIDQLSQLVGQLSQHIQNMAKQQVEFHERVERAQAEWEQNNNAAPYEEPRPAQQQTPPKSKEDMDREEIEALMLAGRYQDGTIKWLQSQGQQGQLFDTVIRKHMFDFSMNLSQVVLLSVSAALTSDFSNVSTRPDRLAWLEGCLNAVNPLDDSIQEHVEKIMAVITQRLDKLFAEINNQNSNQPSENAILRKIVMITKKARELGKQSVTGGGTPLSYGPHGLGSSSMHHGHQQGGHNVHHVPSQTGMRSHYGGYGQSRGWDY